MMKGMMGGTVGQRLALVNRRKDCGLVKRQ